MPGQAIRQRSVRFKIHPIELEFRKNHILLVDDSIVRGTTMPRIIEMARRAGARKVYVAIASPPLRSPCPYGVDLPTYDEFIAHERTIEEVRKRIGADGLFYLRTEDLIAAVRRGNPRMKSFCTGCMNQRYPTPEVTKRLLLHMGRRRSHTRDSASEGADEGAGLLSLV
jgi:amidophosphoribosyltransferase